MRNVVDIGFMIAVDALAVGVVGGVLWQRGFRKYKYIVFYAVCMVVFDLLRYGVLRAYGLQSPRYFYVYYLGEDILAVLQNLLILSFFDLVFQGSFLRSQVRLGILGFFGLVASMSYIFIANSQQSHFWNRLMVEFQQNMFFVSVVLAVLMCISLAHLRVADPQLGLLMSGLGILIAMQASAYALLNLLPKDLYLALMEVILRLPVLATACMLGLWNYALLKIPASELVADDAVLIPALNPSGGEH